MADTYFFRIIASNGVFFEGKIKSVILPTIDGQIELLAHHEEMIIAVDIGSLKFRTPDDE